MWKAFLTQCKYGSKKQTIINLIGDKTKSLRLDGVINCRTSYIDKYKKIHDKLVQNKEPEKEKIHQ